MIACTVCTRPLTITKTFWRDQHLAVCENGHDVVVVAAPPPRLSATGGLDIGLPDVHTASTTTNYASCRRALPFVPYPIAGVRMCRGRRRDRIRRRGVNMLLN